MADEPDNLTLRMLRQVDAKIDAILDLLNDQTARVGSLASEPAGVRTDRSGLRTDFVRLEHRIDRFDERLLRIERRLDPIEA